IALLMPITSPLVLTRAPPELPGLIGASVCNMPLIDWLPPLPRWFWSPPTLMVRFLALMMPAVTEPSRPSGLPSARTVSPTLVPSLSPNLAAVTPEPSATAATSAAIMVRRPNLPDPERPPAPGPNGDRGPPGPAGAPGGGPAGPCADG